MLIHLETEPRGRACIKYQIGEELRSKLFDAFYSTKSEGMGMGLNICRSIAELHGGELIVKTTPGGGSTFSFTVPVIGAEGNKA